MKIIISKNLLLYCCIVILLSCNSSYLSGSLREGDLLFQDLNCGDLCDAIEAVTEGVHGKDFSHCGMVVSINDTLKVIEAIGDEVQMNTLATFFRRSGDTTAIRNITVTRVRKEYKQLINKATNYAIRQIGQPYDQEFLLDNGSWYCSELLYSSFKKANNENDFFELNPMTFKNPETQTFFPAWVAYYKDLNKEIPEAVLGLNPGSISRSEKIQVVKIEKLKGL